MCACVNILVSFSELLPFAHGLGRFFSGPLPNWPKASLGMALRKEVSLLLELCCCRCLFVCLMVLSLILIY